MQLRLSAPFRCLFLLGLSSLAAAPQTPPAPLTSTAILTNLIVKPDIDRQAVTKLMPEEVRETVKLYLAGKITQWYSRTDGKGVVFLMNCASVAEAKAVMEALPLAKAGLVNLDYTGIAPLQPLRYLLQQP